MSTRADSIAGDSGTGWTSSLSDPIPFVFDRNLPIEDRIRRVYRHQITHLPVYRRFVEALGAPPAESIDIQRIPLLPIRAFRDHELFIPGHDPHSDRVLRFSSSGTTGSIRSRHIVMDPRLYAHGVIRGFDRIYGPGTEHSDHALIPYLPGYADNPESSLIEMINILAGHRTHVHLFPHEPEGFLREFSKWIHAAGHPPVILFGAAFGLLDLIDAASVGGPYSSTQLPAGSILLETGGMKTHRRAMSRDELHQRLSDGFGVPPASIHSEYGMCEMLSQAYSKAGGPFEPPPWLLFQVRHPDDPSVAVEPGREGKLGFIDLANLHSCAFVLTDDRAVMGEDGSVHLIGRWPGAETRGCNFLIDRD